MELGIVPTALTGVTWVVEQAAHDPVKFGCVATYLAASTAFKVYYGAAATNWVRGLFKR